MKINPITIEYSNDGDLIIKNLTTSDIVLDFSESKDFRQNISADMAFVRIQMNWMHDLFCAQGYLFVNDVLKTLGLGVTGEGAIRGWIKTEDFKEIFTFTKDAKDRITIILKPDSEPIIDKI